MDELKKILKAAFYRGNEVADMPSDHWEGLADDWEKWYDKYVVNDFSKHIVIETNPIGDDYVILNEATYRNKQGCERTACYEYVDGKQIYYTHKDNVHSR